MNTTFTKHILLLLFIVLTGGKTLYSQSSVLVNFGTTDCNNSASPSFSIIKDPLTATPVVLTSCDVSAQDTTIFGVFIAYNPQNNKLYMADVKTGITTKVWTLDMGLPYNITCPASIPIAPDYLYNHSSNNFEFDNNGNLWSLANYNDTTGTCDVQKLDLTTGNILSTTTIQFPAGSFPSDILSGDICILPNGRMFAVLGSVSSLLYEINNYTSGTTGTATFLQNVPQNSFGIAYLNGQLELTGSDFIGGCYYYLYDIAGNTLSASQPFQVGQLPIDNTSITPSIGSTKQLTNVVIVNSNTADLTYEVYVRNMGNTILNNVNVTDDLGVPFGAANVSNVAVSFVPGNNNGGLTLNPAYDGTTVTSLLNTGQQLPNQTSTNNDYYFKLQISCRVTNLISGTTYYNSAIGSGDLGQGTTLINVTDSSNNGPSTVVDPNNNSFAGDPGENVPTPFAFNVLPVDFISISATLLNITTSSINWLVATPIVNAERFNVEFSRDGRSWTSVGTINITNNNQGSYQFTHNNIPIGYLYYRIKEIDNNSSYSYSNIVLLNNNPSNSGFVIYPNPAGNYIGISAPYNFGKAEIILYDAIGRKIIEKEMNTSTMQLNTSRLPDGSYVLKIINNGVVKADKILIAH